MAKKMKVMYPSPPPAVPSTEKSPKLVQGKKVPINPTADRPNTVIFCFSNLN